jgi:hypothetical protein
VERAHTRHHMSCSTKPCLPAKMDSEAVMCPVGFEFRISDRKGSDAATCTVASDPASLQGRALVHHVSYSSESCLLTREGSGVPCVMQLRIMPPCKGGLRSVACLTAPDLAFLTEGLRCHHHMPYSFLCAAASNIKKSLTGLPVQLGSHVPNAHAYISNEPDVRVMGL